jgi:hypothetical protein
MPPEKCRNAPPPPIQRHWHAGSHPLADEGEVNKACQRRMCGLDEPVGFGPAQKANQVSMECRILLLLRGRLVAQ